MGLSSPARTKKSVGNPGMGGGRKERIEGESGGEEGETEGGRMNGGRKGEDGRGTKSG